MTKTLEINIGGELRKLRFSNFASEEIMKTLYKVNHIEEIGHTIEISDYLAKLVEMNKTSHFLLIKTLVWAGLMEYDLIINDSLSFTKQEVGEWVADMEPKESIKVWTFFLNADGHTLKEKEEAEKVSEEPDQVEKKK